MKRKRLKIDGHMVEVSVDAVDGSIVLDVREDHDNDWSPVVLSMTAKQAVAIEAALGEARMELEHAKVTKLVKKERKR